jgi:hypothetical protein
MPCYRCGTRQVDPVRGHSPWQRGVRDNQQVLVCPDCQALPGWTADLDACPQCGSVRLVRRLGEVECRQCGHVVPPGEPAGDGVALTVAPGLAEEVALALERVLGRTDHNRAVRAPAP